MSLMDLGRISIDGGTQTRAALDQAVVAEYADALRDGAKLPAVVVFFDGSAHWLADGFHRYFAHKDARKASINVEIRQGTQREAILHSVGANATHGLRRTNEDKRRAVMTLLNDAEWSQFSDREVARLCGVSNTFVSNLRAPKVESVDSGKRGAVSTVDTLEPVDNSAKKQAPAVESPNENTVEAGEPYTPETYAQDQADDAITILSQENDELRARLAIGLMDGTEEEKQEAADTIDDLRQQVRTLTAENSALKASRDHYQAEASQLRKQIKMNAAELKRARAAA